MLPATQTAPTTSVATQGVAAIPERMEINGQITDRIKATCPALGLTFFRYYQHGKPAILRDNVVIVGSLPPRSFDDSPAQFFSKWAARAGKPLEFDTRPEDPIRDELAAFSADYPKIAERLFGDYKPARSTLEGLFPLGQVRITHKAAGDLKVNPEVFRTLLMRHLAGDHGLFGKSVGEGLKPEWAFCPILGPRFARSAEAISTGHGIVLSRYDLYDDSTKSAHQEFMKTGGEKSQFHRRAGDYLDVVTLVAGPQSQTMAATYRDNLGLPE